MNGRYTNERNIQMVIALMKAHNIHKVVASPGTTNITFVASIQDDCFDLYGCNGKSKLSFWFDGGILSQTADFGNYVNSARRAHWTEYCTGN